MPCFMKREDKSLIYVDNVETTGERCCHLSPRTPLNSAVCTFIGMKQISHTFMYIIPVYFRLTAFTKTLPEMSFDGFFLLFVSLYIMTRLTAGVLTYPQLPATASNMCTTDAWLGAVDRVPPPTIKNPGYAGECMPMTWGYWQRQKQS